MTDLRKVATDIMDNACLPEQLVKNGVDAALRRDMTAALEAERERCAKICDKQAEIAELRAAWYTYGEPRNSTLNKIKNALNCAAAIRVGKQ